MNIRTGPCMLHHRPDLSVHEALPWADTSDGHTGSLPMKLRSHGLVVATTPPPAMDHAHGEAVPTSSAGTKYAVNGFWTTGPRKTNLLFLLHEAPVPCSRTPLRCASPAGLVDNFIVLRYRDYGRFCFWACLGLTVRDTETSKSGLPSPRIK